MKRIGLAACAALAAVLLAGWTFDWAGHVELDAEGLAHEDPVKRLEAVGELGKYDIALTEAHLLRALDDKDERVSHAAAKHLGQGRSRAAARVMIEWLSSFDPKTRQVAAIALGEIGGADAAAALTRSLGDVDDGVRLHTVRALGTLGRRGNPNVVIALIPRLDDTKGDVRMATIQQLEELGDRRAVIPLVAKFADVAPTTRAAAVRAVGKLGDRSAVPALIRLMSDPHDDVRTAAVGALGVLGAVEAIDALTEQLGVGSDLFRAKVAFSLGQIAGAPGSGKAGEDAMRTLVANLALPQHRGAAREALRIAGVAAVPALVAHLQGRLAGDPTSAVVLLGDAADARATAALTVELERGRVAAPLVLRALGATGDPAALVPVLRALGHKDGAIRIAAMEALRPLIGTDARAGDVLLEHLQDDDLEIRVLAAEYLGVLRVGSATARLAALAGPGNPTRLRRAAIDALGEIRRPEATRALLGVLRDGPGELHKGAATALAYIADPAALPALMELARADRGPRRHEVVRALGGTLRSPAGAPRRAADPAARKLLRELAEDASIKVSLAAIAGLAAAGDPADLPFLRGLVAHGAADRRRAAAWALGELRDGGAIDLLAAAMSGRDDRTIGDAAWALGEILAASPGHPKTGAIVDRWLYLAKHGGWAAAIDGAAGIARVLWAAPAAERAALLGGGRRAKLIALQFHRSRLVRINAAHALASLGADDEVLKALTRLLTDDPSARARIAAARALARIGGSKVRAPLDAAAADDPDPRVRDAAKAAQAGVPPPAARTEWRTYYVVDPGADDAPVRQERYFVHTHLDDLVWATYTDARGELTTEHVPAGERADETVMGASRESEY